MKKVKTLLVTAVAALSMTACSLEDVKNFPAQAGGKISEVFNSLLEKVGLKKKEEKKEEEVCQHRDDNHDGVCDLCGQSGLTFTHVDADNDFVCDECGSALQVQSVRLDDSAVQKLFSKGETFNAEGLKVIATSEVGSEKELEFTLSEPNMEQLGDQDVVVTYGTGENDKLSYSINISYWSEDDLDVFEAGSLTSYAPLPFLPGHNMQVKYTVDDQDYLESWWIEADDAEEVYLDYYNTLLAWNEVVVDGDTTLTFKLLETSVKGEGFHDLKDVSVLRLTPTTIEIEDGEEYTVRAFTADEYFIFGVNAEGKLVIESRIVDATLDGYFFGADLADGYWGFPAKYNSYINYLPSIVNYYNSELSASAFVVPVLSNTAKFVPMSYKALYPLAESLDAYTYAWFVQCDGAPVEDYNAWIAALTAFGYEQQTDNDGVVSYVIDDEFYGYMEFVPKFYEAEGDNPSSLCFGFYYKAPKSYTNHVSLVADKLGKDLGITLSVDNSKYKKGYYVIATGSFAPENVTTGEKAAEALARMLLEQSYQVTTTISYKEQYKQYSFGMSDGTTAITAYVDEAAKEDKFGFELYMGDSKPLSLTNAELAIQKACLAKNQFKGLKGVDYTEDSENHTFSMTFTLAGFGSAAYLKAGAESTLSYLADSFEKFTSEAGTAENTWVTVFRDVENSVQVTATSSISGEDLVVTVVFENKIFETPESTMVKFLTAKNGAAPAASDYAVAQDGSASATFTVEGTFTAENLQTEAEKMIAHFPTGFAKIISEAGSTEGTWLVLVENTALEIQGIISATLAEGGISFVVSTRVTVFDADHVARDFNATLAKAGISLSATWDATYEEYSLGVSFGASTDESSSNLGSGALTLGSYLGSYMEKKSQVYGDPTAQGYYDMFGDQSYYFYVLYVSKDGSSKASVVSYIYGGELVAQISIWDVA